MTGPGKGHANCDIERQVAAEVFPFEWEMPGHQCQVGTEEYPRIAALQAQGGTDNGVNLLGEFWLMQVSSLEDPNRGAPVAANQPPEDKAHQSRPPQHTDPQDAPLPQRW